MWFTQISLRNPVFATMVMVAFVVLGLPNAIVWGAITAIASVLPMLGSALVWPGCRLRICAATASKGSAQRGSRAPWAKRISPQVVAVSVGIRACGSWFASGFLAGRYR
jgi:hypothetical protein